jgi:hypothetical protein
VPAAEECPINDDNYVEDLRSRSNRSSNPDIVIPPYEFSPETHDEDFHCHRLAVGFASLNGTLIPIGQDDPILECLLFPDLYPHGYGHYVASNTHDRTLYHDTLIKDAKLKLLCPLPDFRLHWYWPKWVYMQAEKIRIHQNSARLLRQRQHDNQRRPRGGALLQQSLYTNQTIISESITTSVPSFVRTGDTYFHRREMHFNTMIEALGLPQLFVTFTFSEQWPQLALILKSTDNGDPLPPNRPLHVTLYCYERFDHIRNFLLKNKIYSGFGDLKHFVERHEFQNRGAFHAHCAYWATKSISELIALHYIRADMPDQTLEPELWAAVNKHQIHKCMPHLCQGPVLDGQCKKGFPAPLSLSTHNDNAQMRYTYRRTREADRYVVPYIPVVLLAMDSHMNAQYVSSKGLARYMTKYMLKKEPSSLFNIRESANSIEAYKPHVSARRMSSLEVMALLLGKPIINTSIACSYFTTDLPNLRTAVVLPAHRVLEGDDNPYYPDAIEKYFQRPRDSEFDDLTYQTYWSRYNIAGNSVSATRLFWTDMKGRKVVKRSKPILLRYRHLRVDDGESYFYQQLLLTGSWRSEEELKGGYATYRDHHAALCPQEHALALRLATRQSNVVRTTYLHQYENLVNELVQSAGRPVQEIVHQQLPFLYRFPTCVPSYSQHMLDRDQYRAYSIILDCIGPPSKRNWPFFS